MKIILAFKTHFDIGFTKLASEIIAQYSGKMLPDVVATCNGTADMGKLRYVWTMPSWPLKVMQDCTPDMRKELDRLVRDGQIAFHALPYTSHTDFCGMADTIQGLRYGTSLSEEYGVPQPVSAKMTDVPGHGRSLPMLLAKSGIRFLHLGCNAYATPPSVPPLFFWEAPDGSRVLTMYSKGGYGSSMIPPEDWPFPVWMALMHTQDNMGPQSAELIREMVAEAHEAMPDAEILCGTMDDFYGELEKCDLSQVPVVRGDLADSWIHGVGSYPAEVRQVRRARRDLAKAGAAVFALDGDRNALSAAAEKSFDSLCLFGEHTWGLDVKTWMKPERAYTKKAFRKAKETAEYARMEQSWDEQRQRAASAESAAKEALAAVKPGEKRIFNPNGSPFSGWVETDETVGTVLCGRSMTYAREVPALGTAPAEQKTYAPSDVLENHRYRLMLDRTRGVITELYDKKSGCLLAKERNGVGVFSYQYDIYGIQEMTEYLRNYAYRFFDWGIRDNGKDFYPEIPHKTFRPRLTECREEGHTLTLCYTSEASQEYGDGKTVRVSVALPPEGEELLVRVELEAKEETGLVESGSLCVPLAEDHPRYRFNKNGDLIDPAEDIQDCANHAMYALEAFACAEGEKHGLCVVTHDAPLVGIGETGIYSFRRIYEAHEPILYFNLFNNMWGTNFPQWIGGNLTWDFTAFGYEGTCDGCVMNRALALDRGGAYLPASEVRQTMKLPRGMEILLLVPRKDGWFLVLRDTEMESREGTLEAPGWKLYKADLRQNPIGTAKENFCTFNMQKLGVYGFVLTK